MKGQRIRIKLQGFDYRIIDQSASEIVETAKRSGARVSGPVPLPTRIEKLSDKSLGTLVKALFETYVVPDGFERDILPEGKELVSERIEEVRGELYRSGKTERAIRTTKPYFTLKESHFRVRSISLDLEKSPAEEKKRVALALREALAKLEGAAT